MHLRDAVAPALLAGGDRDALPVRALLRGALARDAPDRARRDHRLQRGDAQFGRLLHREIHLLARRHALHQRDASGDSRSSARCASTSTVTRSRSMLAMRPAYSPPRPLNSVTASPARSRSTCTAWCAASSGSEQRAAGAQRLVGVEARTRAGLSCMAEHRQADAHAATVVDAHLDAVDRAQVRRR